MTRGIFCRISLLLLTIFVFVITAQSINPNIAVLELSGTTSKSELITLTDKLTNELIKTKKFSVIERAQMEEILREQGFQQTGCTDGDCAVEVGQLLGAEQMVAGSIGKVGKVYTITLRLLDVRTGRIIKNVSINIKGSIEDILFSGIAEAVEKLSEKDIATMTPEEIEADYKKRVKIKNGFAISTTVTAVGLAGCAVYFFIDTKKYDDLYNESGHSSSEYDSYYNS